MLPIHHLLRAASRASITLRRASFTPRLRREEAGSCRKTGCSTTPREEFGVPPEPPMGSIELPLPAKVVRCRPLDPCAPPGPKKRYPWEELLEVSVTFALLVALSLLHYKKWLGGIHESRQEVEDKKEELMDKVREYEDMKEDEEMKMLEKVEREVKEAEEGTLDGEDEEKDGGGDEEVDKGKKTEGKQGVDKGEKKENDKQRVDKGEKTEKTEKDKQAVPN